MDLNIISEIDARFEKAAMKFEGTPPKDVVARTFVEPLLRSLDWDTADVDEVSFAVPSAPSCLAADYLLTANEAPSVAVFVAGSDFFAAEGEEQAKDFLSATRSLGAEWCVLTDGRTVAAYHPSQGLPFAVSTITREGNALELLRKESVSDGSTKRAWADGQVRSLARDGLLEYLGNMAFARRMKCFAGMSFAEIEQAMRSLDITVDGVPVRFGREQKKKEKEPSTFDGAAMRRRMIHGIEVSIGQGLSAVRGKQAYFQDQSGSFTASVSPSKKYLRGRRDVYWYNVSGEIGNFAEGRADMRLAFGMEGFEEFALLPYEQFATIAGMLNTTNPDGRKSGYMHVFIAKMEDGDFWICRNHTATEPVLSLRDCMLPLPPEEPQTAAAAA